MRYNSVKDPIRIYNEILGGKWRLLILFQLFTKTQRFKDLQSNVPGITPRMLTKELRNLERFNIVEKEVYREVPPRVEYSLTDNGVKLYPLIESIIKFGEDFEYLLSDSNQQHLTSEEEIVEDSELEMLETDSVEIVESNSATNVNEDSQILDENISITEENITEKNNYFIVEKIEEQELKPIHKPSPKKKIKPKNELETKVVQLELF